MRIEGSGREITMQEARQAISELVGADIGAIDGFMIAAHRPEDDGYMVTGSFGCHHCRAGFLGEAALRVLADAPHEHDGFVTIEFSTDGPGESGPASQHR
jgi:hypothetical protein